MAADPQQILALRNDPASIAPERAIVFEVEGSLKDFYEQARAIGLEYLGDYEDDFAPSGDFYDQDDPGKSLAGRIYLAMPDVQALRELLSLWRRYKNNERMPTGRGPWRELFSQLIDVRPWGPQDRIPDETIKAFAEDLERAPDAPVRFEVELWYHENAERRAGAIGRLTADIESAGGAVVDHAVVSEIRYDAALVDLPAASVRTLLDNPDIGLARADDVMFLRPQSVARSPASEIEGENGPGAGAAPVFVSDEPIAALLDGLPVENHARLAGRLRVDDPEGLAETYPVAQREHGTEMASLIIHGDLNHGEPPLPRPLYVRPVFRPTQGGERTPDDRLLVDVIHQAVRRIKVGEGQEPAAAPQVVLINLSLADEKRPFARIMSPLGRLLDYLSWRYRVLFLVSAGNITDRLKVEGYANWTDFEAANAEDREKAVFASLNAQKSQRTLLSPAESMNALTIGAAHAGSAFNGGFPAGRIDPFTAEGVPNIISAMGLGFKKVVKPELLFSGGRAPVQMAATGGELVVMPVRAGAQHFGLKVARPSAAGGTSFEDFTWGTSAATALATRAAHRIHDVLLDGDGGSHHADVTTNELPLLLKALMVHGAQWSNKGAMLDGFFGPQGQGSHLARRDDITRLLGYGVPDIQRVLDCAENRATLLGTGTIDADSAVLYRIPLPDGLDGVRALRGLTTTLAWFSPVNPRHQGYRMAALDVSAASDDKYWMADERDSYQPTDKAVVRGTVCHERRTGEAARVFVDDGNLLLRVSCRAAAGTLADPVPYALAVSFEVAIDTGIPVYEQVRERLGVPVRAGIAAGA
ncbi:hypothetical protein JOH52_000805 [Sinorhizobium meliloti]|uniref:S8 family peptidase n=1 Tax=Rhizobium meliloti TaxID=382 RepID=UPI001402968C|nr:S8 family peptidase [Sinorhizobium meliloti]MBP2464784.1 hypothetical protein [Sinorhizobium meliloti]